MNEEEFLMGLAKVAIVISTFWLVFIITLPFAIWLFSKIVG